MLELTWPGKTSAAQRASSVAAVCGPVLWRPENAEQSILDAGLPVASRHRIFAGDNLEALAWLKTQGEKYDVIYIDPPYNTGSSLTYNDKKSGGGTIAWLNEIYPRLILAREILHNHGILFVSIDDNEACHLLTLLREIFGQENHLGTLKWRRKRKPSFLDKHISAVFEYVLVFSRDAKLSPRLLGGLTEELTRPVLNASNRTVERIIPKDFPAHCADGIYEENVYRNRSLSFELLEPLKVFGGKVQEPVRVLGPFRIQQDLWERTGFITRNFGLRRRVLPEEQKRRHAADDGSELPTNEDAHDELKAVFGERVFDFPKPVGLLAHLLSMVPPVDCQRPQRCLDFYAGSGSFLIAALEQSRQDGQARQVDLVQSRERIRSASVKQFSDIAEICAHRVCVDSTRRGFLPSFEFLQFGQQE